MARFVNILVAPLTSGRSTEMPAHAARSNWPHPGPISHFIKASLPHALPWTWTIKCISDFIADLKWYLCFLSFIIQISKSYKHEYSICLLFTLKLLMAGYILIADIRLGEYHSIKLMLWWFQCCQKNVDTPISKLIQRCDFLTMYCSELHNIGKQTAVSMSGTGSCWDRKMATWSAGKEKCFSSCLGER